MALGLLDQLYANKGASGDWMPVYNAAKDQGWNADQAANYVSSLGLGNVSSADVNNWLSQNNLNLSPNGANTSTPTASIPTGTTGPEQNPNSLVNSIARDAVNTVMSNPSASTNYGNAYNKSGAPYSFNDTVNYITDQARQGYTANNQIPQQQQNNYLTMDQLNSWWNQNNPMNNFNSQLDNWWNSKGLSNLYGGGQVASAPRNAGNRSRYFNPSTGDYVGLGTMYAQPQSL